MPEKSMRELLGSPVKEKENFPHWCNTKEAQQALRLLRTYGTPDTVIFRAAVIYLAEKARKEKQAPQG